MRTGREIACIVCMIVSLAAAGAPLMAIQDAGAESRNVAFELSFSYVSATFRPRVTVSDGTIEPAGKSVSAPIALEAGMLTISLTIPAVGSVSMDIDPMGTHSYEVPGLYYDYGIVQFGIILDTKGTMDGTIGTGGPGSCQSSSLSWSSSGSRSINLVSDSSSADGDTITLTLQTIQYSIWVGATAAGDVPFLGHMSVTLIDYQKLGSIDAAPSSVSGTYDVRTPSLISGLGGMGSLLLILIVVIVIALVVASVGYAVRKRRKNAAQKSSQNMQQAPWPQPYPPPPPPGMPPQYPPQQGPPMQPPTS